MTDTPPPSAPPTSPPPSAPIKRSLLDRFPALARITDKVGAREIPYISQLEYSDCGAACLTMVLHFHGKEGAILIASRVLCRRQMAPP